MKDRDAGFLIKQIHTALEKEANKLLAADDLTQSQVGLLLELREADEETLTFKAMEKKLGLAQSTTVGLIARLEKKGMIAVHVDPMDRRTKYAVLTDAGRRCCEKAERSMKAQEEILLGNLNASERVQFIDFLQKVREALQK